MKYVDFNSVKIRNFLSIGKDPVEISFKHGLNVITGVNRDKEDRRNGVGKSTIADAIHFAIFGETIREVSPSRTSTLCSSMNPALPEITSTLASSNILL